MTPLRLPPGTDLKAGLLALLADPAWAGGAFVVAGIGSLHDARLRLAAADAATEIAGPCELLSLQGTLSADGAHLHMALADAQGRVWGGHVLDGNRIRTTAELLLSPLPGWQLGRAPDPATGYAELVVQPRR
ncbi:DUF296 domain-containing protein [Ideonella sp. 4Y11]|uniref:DUF296 domain-containing protein n=1 Tax=Ideonella aquatica TaxID=2824119 RepID=A0A940YKT9_9BURK|nr:DUF296 domain-containing protein [Ideonella aquatica]MBQ0958852.1 DUF296 domain-containing protein [Ideonella aquatica]